MPAADELYLLSKRDKLNGPRRVTVTVRPPRVAYLVNPSDAANALAAVDSACLTWGGYHNFFVPCVPGGSPDEVWAEILDKLDPDLIADLVGVSASFSSEQLDRWGRVVIRWENPKSSMRIFGLLVYAALRRWRRLHGEEGQTRNLIVYPDPLGSHPLALPLAFRFGHRERRPMEQNMLDFQAYTSWSHEQSMQVRVFDPTTMTDDELFESLASATFAVERLAGQRLPGLTSFHLLPLLTKQWIQSREPGWRDFGSEGPPPEYEQYEEAYWHRRVVIGAADSVADFCLAWDLRAQTMVHRRLPIWILPQWLGRQELPQYLRVAVANFAAESLSHAPAARDIHFLSASMSKPQLVDLSRNFSEPHEVHDREDLAKFFTRDFRIGDSTTVVAHFTEGAVEIPFPDFSRLGDFSEFDSLEWSVEIAQYRPPRVGPRYDWRQGDMSRLAADGIAGSWNVWPSKPGDLLTIGTNNSWRVLSGVAAAADYTIERSDKANLAITVMELLRDISGLRILASSALYRLFREMAEIVPRQAVQQFLRRAYGQSPTSQQLDGLIATLQAGQVGGGQFDRQHRTRSSIRQSLGVDNDVADVIVDELVKRRVLFRGYEVTCPNCRVKRWYPIDRLAELHRCDLCQVVSPSPVPPDRLEWRYRLNEVVGRSMDQGVLPHLHAAVHAIQLWGGYNGDLFGLVPGVLLTARSDAEPSSAEIDIVVIKAGHVIVGECKAAGSELRITETDKLAQWARVLGATRIIYATPGDDAFDPSVLEHARSLRGSPVVEIWTADQLLDGSANAAATERARQYLRDLANEFRSPE